MEVAEAIIAKRQLETQLAQLFQDFTASTRLQVDSIYVTTVPVLGSEGFYTVELRCAV